MAVAPPSAESLDTSAKKNRAPSPPTIPDNTNSYADMSSFMPSKGYINLPNPDIEGQGIYSEASAGAVSSTPANSTDRASAGLYEQPCPHKKADDSPSTALSASTPAIATVEGDLSTTQEVGEEPYVNINSDGGDNNISNKGEELYESIEPVVTSFQF